MAVEARHLNLFPSQLIENREIMNAIGNNGNIYSTQMGMGYGVPLSGTTADTLLPFYNSVISDSVPATTTMKADSGLTYNLPVSRKRSRDSTTNSFIAMPESQKDSRTSPLSFLGEDISLQIQQQQLEIDRLIDQHTEKVRLELAERRKRHSRRLVAAVEEGIMKRLRAKEEEIEKIGKLNWVLEERVKSLCLENQIWRDLAQSNEATANALRSNLEQVLAQVNEERHRGAREDDALADDAQSCCGSSDYGAEDEGRRRTVAESGGGERILVNGGSSSNNNGNSSRSSFSSNRWCRNCGKEESSVLLLPCRHLCLCTICGSTLHTCPICKSNKNASVHVNMSS
ncbi:PREDICTED: probable BOI-related E3 ubiquitin-protein ligase 3 [Nelumbo nucifera]|uniref:RING-type E3 ubiquitin transferase n=1 Tax=Nelumbo nucifera TaxID=4432 RepID=A0A1U7Z5J0_NELNU|nr:PREDICTED: probable BOI-related E3 ubiquitin-protein ligase 3 [Nelumbo nucifera]